MDLHTACQEKAPWGTAGTNSTAVSPDTAGAAPKLNAAPVDGRAANVVVAPPAWLQLAPRRKPGPDVGVWLENPPRLGPADLRILAQ